MKVVCFYGKQEEEERENPGFSNGLGWEQKINNKFVYETKRLNWQSERVGRHMGFWLALHGFYVVM